MVEKDSYLCFVSVSTEEKSELLSLSVPSLTEDVFWGPSEKLFKTRGDNHICFANWCVLWLTATHYYCNYHLYNHIASLYQQNLNYFNYCTQISLSVFFSSVVKQGSLRNSLSSDLTDQCFGPVRDKNKRYKLHAKEHSESLWSTHTLEQPYGRWGHV